MNKQNVLCTSVNIPDGTTHVCPTNELDYNPKPDFFRWEFLRYNSVDETWPPKPVYELQWWSNRFGWVKDNSFSNKHKKLIKLDEYLELNHV